MAKNANGSGKLAELDRSIELLLKTEDKLNLTKDDSFSDIDENGGALKIIAMVESGYTIPKIAKTFGVNLMYLKMFMQEAFPPDILEAINTTLYDQQYDRLLDEADAIEVDHRRVAAKLNVLGVLSSRETIKYREKSIGTQGPGVHIMIDWANLPEKVPTPLTIENGS